MRTISTYSSPPVREKVSPPKHYRPTLITLRQSVSLSPVALIDTLSKSDLDLDMFITDFFGVSLNEVRNNLEYGKQIYEFVQVYYR